jgi:hypothetical protein
MGAIFEVGRHDGTKLRAHVIVEIIRNLPPDFFAVDSMGFLVKSQLLLFVDQYLIRALCSITTVEPSRIPPFSPCSVKARRQRIAHHEAGPQQAGFDRRFGDSNELCGFRDVQMFDVPQNQYLTILGRQRSQRLLKRFAQSCCLERLGGDFPPIGKIPRNAIALIISSLAGFID